MKSSSLRIVVSGLIGQHPLLGGMTWHYLQYVLGLAQLGHDAFYVEDSGEWPYNLDGGASGEDYVAHGCAPNIRYLAKVMASFGLGDRWAYRCPIDEQWHGLPGNQRKTVLKSAELLINVSGSLAHPEQYRQIPRIIYIDTDPVFTQIKLASKVRVFSRQVAAHDVHFSFGERLSKPIPATSFRWRPTRQPVVLSQWRPSSLRREVFSTVMNWASYDPVKYRGRAYGGSKDVEFVRFVDLPARVSPTVLEIAVRGTRKGALPGARKYREPGDLIAYLANRGWRVADAMQVCSDFEGYRRHIESSKAEWAVAKNAYVVGRPGWFSDRSACYLAAGRPVVTQDTGFSTVIPTGKGVLTFSTMDEAIAGIREVESNYKQHAKAAREIAEEFFDSKKVLRRLLDESR